ncbi:hypothetical protein ACFL1M_01580 [Patescibacteria group bacterium]
MKKIFYFGLSQTPIKPLTPAWLRPLLQLKLSEKVATKLGYAIESPLYIDDTSLQVAKLLTYNPKLSTPKENILEFFGNQYIKANSVSGRFHSTKKSLEQFGAAKQILAKSTKEREGVLNKLGIYFDQIHWESDYIFLIPYLIDLLEKDGYILDYSAVGGPVFLDFTNFHLPLIVLKENKTYSFVAKQLAYVFSKIKNHDLFAIQHTDEDQHPFKYIKKFLQIYNKDHFTLSSAKIKFEGKRISSRYGGWEKFTIENFLKDNKNEKPRDIIFGYKLYYFGQHKNQTPIDFNLKSLNSYIKKGKKITRDVKKNVSKVVCLKEDIENPCLLVKKLLNKFDQKNQSLDGDLYRLIYE